MINEWFDNNNDEWLDDNNDEWQSIYSIAYGAVKLVAEKVKSVMTATTLKFKLNITTKV